MQRFGFVRLRRVIKRVYDIESGSRPLLLFERSIGRELAHERSIVKLEGEEEYFVNVTWPLNGIICQMSRFYDGNICKKGIVDAIGDSVVNWDACSTAEVWNCAAFYSIDLPDQSLCYDFKERHIAPSA